MKNAALCILLAFVTISCGAASGLVQEDEQESLSKSTDLYYKLIMWKYYEKAAQFVDPEKSKEYESFVLRNEKDLNITGYEIKEVTYVLDSAPSGDDDKKEEATECEVRVHYTYYKYPSVSEKSVMTQDKWIKKGKVWYVSSDYEEIFN